MRAAGTAQNLGFMCQPNTLKSAAPGVMYAFNNNMTFYVVRRSVDGR